MEGKIFRLLVPEEEETEIKNGKKKVVKKKFFPGYALAEMIMTDDSWYVVRNTPGVTGFIGRSGGGTNAAPLWPEASDPILHRRRVHDQVATAEFALRGDVRVAEG